MFDDASEFGLRCIVNTHLRSDRQFGRPDLRRAEQQTELFDRTSGPIENDLGVAGQLLQFGRCFMNAELLRVSQCFDYRRGSERNRVTLLV